LHLRLGVVLRYYIVQALSPLRLVALAEERVRLRRVLGQGAVPVRYYVPSLAHGEERLRAQVGGRQFLHVDFLLLP